MLQGWIAAYGVPQALYVDAKNVFVRQGTSLELAAGIAPVTQFERMCAKLGIRIIVAKTPEAKGRVERVHGTNQDRLVKKLRRRGITTYAAANEYLETTYWPAHNARFAVAPLDVADFHLPLDRHVKLADVFCLETQRVVGNDWVVRYDNRALQVVPTARAKRFTGPKARLLVRETVTGEIRLVARSTAGDEQCLEWIELSPATQAARAVERAAQRAAQRAALPVVPLPSLTPPAGYTRAGKPLSAKQMAVRERWNQAARNHIQRTARRVLTQTILG